MEITDTMQAFAEGYALGKQVAERAYKKGSKLNIIYKPTDGDIRLEKLEDGRIVNIGGFSIPF